MCWESLALILILIKRFNDSVTSGSRLLTIFVRDGIIYFVCIQAVTVADLVVLKTLPVRLQRIHCGGNQAHDINISPFLSS